MGFLNVLGFLGICLWMCYHFRRRIEETLPPAICLWMVVLYGLAIIKQLNWVDPLLLTVVSCSAAWLVFRLATRKSTWGSLWSFLKTYLLTPGFVGMILLAGVFWVLTSARYVIDGDELNYWAVEVKSLWYHNGLVDAVHHSALQFSSYTPGMQLIEWWYMHVVGVWRENVLYFALFYTNALFLLPLMRKTTFRQWPSILLFVLAGVLAPTVFSGAVYVALITDASVGILFGYALFMLWQADSEDRFFPLAIGASLSALVLAKQAGIIWTVFALLFFVLVTRKRKPTVRRHAWAFALAAPLAVWLSWYVFCRVNHLGNHLTGSGFSALQAILSGSYVRPSGTGNILKYILYAFVASPPNMSGYWDGKTSWLGLPLLGWLIVFGAIPLLCRRAIQGEGPISRKSMAVRVAVIMVAVGLGYTLIYAISFFTVFSNEVPRYANNQWGVTALMDRYFIPYYFGAGYLSFAILTEQLALWKRQGKKKHGRALTAVLLCILLAFGNWENLWYMWPSNYLKTHNGENWIDYQREHTEWFLAIPEEQRAETRILLASSKIINYLAYAMPPVALRGLSQHDIEGVNPKQALQTYVDQLDITHIVAIDRENATYEFFVRATGMELETDQLYLVDKTVKPYVLKAIPHKQ